MRNELKLNQETEKRMKQRTNEKLRIILNENWELRSEFSGGIIASMSTDIDLDQHVISSDTVGWWSDAYLPETIHSNDDAVIV